MLPLRCRTTGVAFRQLQAPGCRSRSLPAARHTSSIYAKHTALAIQRANTKSICAPKFSRLPQTKELSRIERLPRLACLPLSYASNLIGKRLYSTRSVRHKRYEEELEQEYGAVEPQNQEYYYGGQEHEPLPLHCIFKVLAVVTPPNFFIPWQKKTSKECVGSGFVVETPYGTKLLTNAHVVAYATTVRIRRAGSSQMYRARIKSISYECDLAELEVDDINFWKEGDPEFMRMQIEDEDEDFTEIQPMSSGNTGIKPPRGTSEPNVLDDMPLEDSISENVSKHKVQEDVDIEKYKRGLKLGSLPELHSRVTVAGYPTGGDNISVTRGVVSRIEPQPYAFSPLHQLLAIQIDAAINPGNSGGPALDSQNRVVGVAFQSLQGADNIGYIIPVPIINHFLEDCVRHNGKVEGFVRIGVNTQALDNAAAARAYFNMRRSLTGILVAFVDPVSDAASKLKKDDVILAVDGVHIANDGTIPFRKRERIMFDYLLMDKYVGDSCKLTIWRDRQKHDVEVKLKPRAADLVPVFSPDMELGPPYLIFGGLVFSRLTIAYLSEYGEDWWNQAPRPLVTKAMHEHQKVKDQEIVILCHVLVDDCNFGYNHYMNLQLKKFNNIEVINLKHLDELIENNTSEFARFDMDDHVTIILRQKEALEAAHRIMENHGVPSLKSKHFLRKKDDNPSK